MSCLPHFVGANWRGYPTCIMETWLPIVGAEFTLPSHVVMTTCIAIETCCRTMHLLMRYASPFVMQLLWSSGEHTRFVAVLVGGSLVPQ